MQPSGSTAVTPDCPINQTGFTMLVNLRPEFGLEPEAVG